MSEKAAAQNGSMDEILSSIRTIVKEEADKDGVTPVQDPPAAAMDDVLELTDVVEEEGAPVPQSADAMEAAPVDMPADEPVEDDLVDIDAFAANGEIKPADDDAVQAARAQYNDGAFDDAPQTEQEATPMADTKQDNTQSAEDLAAEMLGEDVAPVEASAAADGDMPSAEDLMAELTGGAMDDIPDVEAPTEASADDIDATAKAPEEMMTSEDMVETSATSEHTEEVPAPVMDDVAEPEPTPAPEVAAAPAAAAVAPAAKPYEAAPEAKRKIGLKAIPTADGLQIGFPVEVLAEALRPLVSEWVAENLPEIVEKLVREELTKLVDK